MLTHSLFVVVGVIAGNHMKVDDPNDNLPQFAESDVLVLQGHESEVVSCAWNPTHSLLASA